MPSVAREVGELGGEGEERVASPEMCLNHMSMGSPFTPFKSDFFLPEEHQPCRSWLSANWIGAL